MRLPAWLSPLPDAAEQRELDRWAIEELGIPGLTLMERAGVGLAELAAELAPQGRIVAVCGKGNNGGDGFVAGRWLRERGRDVDVLLLGDPDELRGDARASYERLEGAAAIPFEAGALAGAAAIIDAILGTGFAGEPRDPARTAIEAINSAGAGAVVACDVPSGVDASTGEIAGVAVRADATATFHAAKPGLWIAPGKAHTGRLRVIDIGIPAGGPGDPSMGLIGPRVLEEIPRRGADATKFAAGSVLVCGGSTGLTGAPCLAAEAASRAGAGYVTACVPESLSAIFEGRLLEVMTVPLDDECGSLQPSAAATVLARSERAQALVLGPGLGREDPAAELARELASRVAIPLLLDADGLNAHASALERLAARGAPAILTPHAGELARLLGMPSAEVGAHRLGLTRRAAASARAIVVLKGDDTIVAEPGGRVGISPGGAPALATAGTGDVLSGVIAALLAKQMDPFHAACGGVFLHLGAGRLAGQRIGVEGVIASDVIAALPGARAGDAAAPAADPLR
jgi:ADP-dependent NAD(P)H-hydrate dehydratase / NAD(P)H-hydrate epimerase